MSIRRPVPLDSKHLTGLATNKQLLISILLIAAFASFWFGKIFLDRIYVPVIIMYHSIGEEGMALDGYGSKLNVRPETFAKQMKFLRLHNYKVIPLVEFIERIKTGKKIPRKTIAITFDDGLKNNFIGAYPILKRYNFPATIFVATNYVGKENFVTWDDLRTMQKSNIYIGSHTMSHAWLPSLDGRELREELSDSKKILESEIGRKVEILSYPLGAFDEKVKKAAKEAGYIGAVAVNPGRKRPNRDVYGLKRIRISMSSESLFVFWIETSGYYTFIKEIRDED